MTTKHEPTTLNFHCLSMCGWTVGAKVEFQSNKGHTLATKLLQEEIDAIGVIIDAAKKRAMKEIPEMVAEVLAEERVAAILKEREEAVALLEEPTTGTGENEIPY